ncbi:MAG: TetR/AcrR family transcriptional regulator [Proteobacteria bacterium]|nr:TetR/AcrR family transcriptional regulator [Pseudomonadota bacterium]
MSRDVNRDAKARILKAGAQIVHRKGFQDTGLQELLTAAGVPKGSFYFHFKNKEDFGLQLIDYYADFYLGKAAEFLDRPAGSPLDKIRRHLAWMASALEANDFMGGCPFGNLAQEMADRNESFREKLETVFETLGRKMAGVLEEARRAGEIDPSLDAGLLADFILNAWQGTILRMKVRKNTGPRASFERMVFDRLLAR